MVIIQIQKKKIQIASNKIYYLSNELTGIKFCFKKAMENKSLLEKAVESIAYRRLNLPALCETHTACRVHCHAQKTTEETVEQSAHTHLCACPHLLPALA
jgi:hypothetical protein